MYTTKQFEDAAIQRGFELDHIILNEHQLIKHASGFVFREKRKVKVRWNNQGVALTSTGLCPEFNLFF